MTKLRPDIPRPTPEAIAQHQELMYQASEKKRLLNLAEYYMVKWELPKPQYEKLVDRIQTEYTNIMAEVKKIHKK